MVDPQAILALADEVEAIANDTGHAGYIDARICVVLQWNGGPDDKDIRHLRENWIRLDRPWCRHVVTVAQPFISSWDAIHGLREAKVPHLDWASASLDPDHPEDREKFSAAIGLRDEPVPYYGRARTPKCALLSATLRAIAGEMTR